MGLFKPKRSAPTNVAGAINHHMSEIRQALGGKGKLTLVIRSELFEKPIIFTNDKPEDAIEAIRQMTDRPSSSSDSVHVVN